VSFIIWYWETDILKWLWIIEIYVFMNYLKSIIENNIWKEIFIKHVVLIFAIPPCGALLDLLGDHSDASGASDIGVHTTGLAGAGFDSLTDIDTNTTFDGVGALL